MMQYLLTDGQLNEPATESLINKLKSSLSFTLPKDYLEFLLMHNGGEGFLGEDYFIFWKVEELNEFNREYEVGKYAPGIFLIASSGGGEAYGFDIQSPEMPIVKIPFIGMNRKYADFVASKFSELFSN